MSRVGVFKVGKIEGIKKKKKGRGSLLAVMTIDRLGGMGSNVGSQGLIWCRSQSRQTDKTKKILITKLSIDSLFTKNIQNLS